MSLNPILQCTKPSYWNEDGFYETATYKMFPLTEDSAEYSEIKKETLEIADSNVTILEIQRIQHPFAYLSCQIKRKQLALIKEGKIPEEKRLFYFAKNETEALKFIDRNCDMRNVSGICQGDNSELRLKEKSELQLAGSLDVVGPPSSEITILILVKQIIGFTSRSSSVYPDYLVKYEMPQTEMPLLITEPEEESV